MTRQTHRRIRGIQAMVMTTNRASARQFASSLSTLANLRVAPMLDSPKRCMLHRSRPNRIPNCRRLSGLTWKILCMPRAPTGEEEKPNKALGCFLQCNADNETVPWSCKAEVCYSHLLGQRGKNAYLQATLRIVSQKDGGDNHERSISHTFTPDESDWGYMRFMAFDVR